MKRRAALCLLAVLCLLVGCSARDAYPEGMNIACKDIALTVPGDFLDLSADSYAGEADFMFGHDTLIFMGLSESKDSLKKMTLDQYTGYVISGNQLSCTPQVFGDGYVFTYEAPVEGTAYTYVTATYEGEENFWIFQFYCPSDKLSVNQPEIDIILESIRSHAASGK